MRPRSPKLPLRQGTWQGRSPVLQAHDAAGNVLSSAEIAWLNRAAESYRTERPKLRRALRRALEELEGAFGGPKDQTEDEAVLLQEIRDVLKPRRKTP